MLIEFSVGNFKSFRDLQTLSLVRGKGAALAVTNSFEIASPNRLHLLRSAAIYGPNAAGKTNLLRAFRAMREVVIDSASWRKDDAIPMIPFRLDAQCETAPSEFEIVFIADGCRYQYGFSATAKRIYEEWLMAYPKGRTQRWFQRTWNEAKNDYEWETGKALQGEKQSWQRSTRQNALFLSTAVQLNSQQLRPVYDWFLECFREVVMDMDTSWDIMRSAELCEKASTKADVIAFLNAGDLFIDDITIERKKLDSHLSEIQFKHQLKDYLLSTIGDEEFLAVSTLHQRTDGTKIPFKLEDESGGTQKLFSIAGPWMDALKNGHVLFTDELHDNLHPNLARFLVNLFHNRKTNPNNAQLIFTTHETAILSQEIFRRDQIWFCERDEWQASQLYPLSDFSPKKGGENIEAAYLSGRYGAVPFVGEMPVIRP